MKLKLRVKEWPSLEVIGIPVKAHSNVELKLLPFICGNLSTMKKNRRLGLCNN